FVMKVHVDNDRNASSNIVFIMDYYEKYFESNQIESSQLYSEASSKILNVMNNVRKMQGANSKFYQIDCEGMKNL
ncbi:hypothetical protein PFISCL1PPCAC_25300, partial [Pristionchus fissidentatus]